MKDYILERFSEAEQVRKAIIENDTLLAAIESVCNVLEQKIKNDNSIFFCGNGGSAADAQHLATELSGRFLHNRAAIKAEALGTNMAFTTAVGNDFAFDRIFARSLEALGRKGDALILISTSGNSPNVIKAADQALSMGITTISLTGSGGQNLSKRCDHSISIPSISVPRIQEAYMIIGHILCEHLEQTLITLNGQK